MQNTSHLEIVIVWFSVFEYDNLIIEYFIFNFNQIFIAIKIFFNRFNKVIHMECVQIYFMIISCHNG